MEHMPACWDFTELLLLLLLSLQWEHTAEAHNKLLIYGSAFGHKKHAVFIVFNQLEKIWQSL